ncbi:hypothetical protein CERSUDRAFT_56896 [Gelatoporia subvermispora B]|uniref:Protein kinase domain-containing protein n=1 Tax=Ceriporiopsis subvermispora (strain B) TaxID=914234 RepID=M2QMY8_CERS8|nr:hypothetical protein CERSUDRAFT_56896 [Gelatoporia subvermispora B]
MEASSSQLVQKREQYRKQIVAALQEDPDPLSAYDDFVKWTIESYPDAQVARSGLLELLEEATRQFVDDPAYKRDLRYLKLWSLYATHVEDPAAVYAFLLAKDIGTVYAHTYQEYANVLEQGGKRREAEEVYKLGIQRRARPYEPLKRRYEAFKSRAGTSASAKASPNAALWKDAPPEAQAIRRNPLQKHQPSASSNSSSSQSGQPTSSRSERYAVMLAPPVPGKRPEKLRFNLGLLFTEDGVEYSMQEARARSMGLLGKKWGPPPPSELRVEVKDHQSETRPFKPKYAEPTVTLATKEALADVFGMYNSPEKTMRVRAGSKHAPVHKIEPVTPIALPVPARVNNENAAIPVKTPNASAFRPFVDEEKAVRKENTPAPPPKPLASDKPSKLPTVTPNRKALSAKDTTTPVAPKPKVGDKAAIPEDPKPVFSAVFTPASAARNKAQEPESEDPTSEDVAEEEEEEEEEALAVFQPSKPTAVPPTKFVPFVDAQEPAPFKVFSRPPALHESARPTPAPAFTPFVDEEPPELAPAPSARQILAERTPFRPFTPSRQQEEDSESESDEFVDEEYVEPEYIEEPQADFSLDESEYDEPTESTAPRMPLGGRFGQFNVMTPITERTYEYTMSTCALNTPQEPDKFTVFRDAGDALESAEQLAAELRDEEVEDEMNHEPEFNPGSELTEEQLEERGVNGTLSLSDALAAASSFNPPNPCNPFDPPIMSTLLSLIPPDHDSHDLRHEEAQQLDALQKFAKKKTRRASGNTSVRMDSPDALRIQIHDRRFEVTEKLGEGGFGAVFEAVDMNLKYNGKGEDHDSDFDDDDDEEDDHKVALKVVKPRNMWEFHVLRRIHRTLPPHLRRSVIQPQALYVFRDKSFLVLELCKQGTLLDIVNRAAAAGVSQQGACLDELLVMFFAIELMRLLEGLHRAGFIHGDVKIDNCLLRLEDVPGPASAWDAAYQPSGAGGWACKGIKFIDFGRTVDTRMFPAAQRFIAEWPTDARDCLEMREGRPWTFQTDYFGLAGIIYCMLYGKYIEAASVARAQGPDGVPRYKLAVPFKRYWQGDLWTRLFDVLLNPTLVRPDGQLPVSDELAVLRTEMEAWLQANCNRASNTLKGLLKKIGLYILGGKDGR